MSMSGEVDFVGMRRGGRNQVAIDFTGKRSRAKQQFRDECDINILMQKYQKGIALTHLNRYQGSYADVSGMVDYQEAQNIVLRAQEAFQSLPASVRAKFENDPGKFMDYALNPENKAALVEMGLAHKPAEPVVQDVRVVNGGDGSDEGGVVKTS